MKEKVKRMQNQMKRLLSLALSLVLVLSLVPMAAFATETEERTAAVNTATGVTYTSVSEACDEAQAGQTVQLTGNFTEDTIVVDEEITLDLAGYALTCDYMASYGDIIDSSEGTTGLLAVPANHLMLESFNSQLPVITDEGYRFVEVIGFNTAMVNENKYAFQPLFEAAAHDWLIDGGISIQVNVTWEQDGKEMDAQFAYSQELLEGFVASYKEATGKYGKMFTLTKQSTGYYHNLGFEALVISDSDVRIGAGATYPGGKIEVDSENKLVNDVTVQNTQGSATIQAGTRLEDASSQLQLTTYRLEDTATDITLSNGETLESFDIHVSGISADNTVPVIITLNELAPEFLNKGNLDLYHVENGVTVPMTRVYSLEEVDAHNEYYYDIATGTVTLAMSTFSEVAVASDDENGWQGNFDYTWYKADAAELYIANADQLAAFGAIVGGMADGIAQDRFSGKTVKLIADINLGDKDDASSHLFYPIGYYNDANSYEKPADGTATAANVTSFQGTFDGQGHIVANFYQNTWQMWGNYDGNHYKAAMGLFGYVLNGTVKNLTVESFSSDGEFTPTGVIAAYAVNSTFENISLTNCNPRVYNTGNGGIIGVAGRESSDVEKLVLKNITVDNSNKISALWGSWDVACGGLVGMYRGNADSTGAHTGDTIHFENCHVSAQIDVYNDVCANYQYYAYRYSGMMIGSVRHNTTDANGKTIPNMVGITANGCTVHFGDWNDYYYCELVANTLASYTHDHQMSRLTQVTSVDTATMKITTLDGETTAIPTSGRYNYVVVKEKNDEGEWIHGDGHDYAECYHFVNGVQHFHDVADNDNTEIWETVNGTEVLKEDKQLVYREFNNLFTGYGWGVTTKAITDYAEDQIKILDREEGSSVVKFQEADTAKDSYTTETTVTIGELFAALEGADAEIVGENVQVFVSPVGETSTAGATYTANAADWTQGTLTFSGVGAATITITDYYFCTPTTIDVTIEERQPVEKFDVVMNNGDFLHRVGNQGTVALSKLFSAKDGASIGNVSVTIETVTGASGTYTPNATWTNGTIQFTGTGVVKVTITDNDYCTPTTLYLEVVDAVNATTATNATANNVVLLNNIGGGFTVSGRYTVYGNGFTLNYTGNGQYLNNGLKQGVVTVSENGTLDNLRIVATIYPDAYMYYSSAAIGNAVTSGPVSTETLSDGTVKNRYHYQLSAVAASGNATISNCYIYGGRNNIFVNTGNVTIEDTILECGVVANVQIQSNADYTVTFEDVTTIQYLVDSNVSGITAEKMLGAGVIVGPETSTNPTIVLNGVFNQYNWVTAADKEAVSNEAAQKIIDGALAATAYNHSINGETASNLGIIYMNEYDTPVENTTGLPYVFGTVSISGANGKVYSLQKAEDDQIYSDYANADKTTENDWYHPQFEYSDDLGGQYVAEGGDEHCYREDDTIKVMFPSGDTKTMDLAAFVNIQKYTGQDLSMAISCKDGDGNAVTVTDGKVTLSVADEYTVTYTVTDTLFYDKNGNAADLDSIQYSWNVTVSVSLKDTAVPDAYFAFNPDSQKMGYYVQNLVFTKNVYQYLPFLAGLKIYDYNGQTAYLRFDGDSDFSKVAKIEVTNNYSGNDALVKVTLVDGGVITMQFLARADSGGGSTYTGSIKTSDNVIYFVNDGTTSESAATTTAAYWYVDYYKFTGNNGVEITSAAQTFNSTGSSASTPSGSFGTTINYTVTYDANGGNCGQTTGYATSVSSAVTLPTPTRSGYFCTGWYTAASGGTMVGDAGAAYTPTANITLYAQWSRPYTVTYNANGGSCETASDTYVGNALVLPNPTHPEGYFLDGWYDAASGGNKIGDAGGSYSPSSDITLYAQWQEQVKYTVTYNANGGSCGTASATYEGTALTLPAATREGYTLNGWYAAASDGTKIGDAGATYTPSANITLYAQWTVNSYTIKVSSSSATVEVNGTTVSNNGTVSIPYGTQVTVAVTYSKNYSQSTTISGADGTTYTSPFTMPAQSVTISASSSGTCLTPDTLVTMADGTQKQIQDVRVGEMVLAWNFYTGQYEAVPVTLLQSHETGNLDILHLYFEDGTELKILGEHGVYDADLNTFVFIDQYDVQDYIGHGFVKQNGDGYTTVKLIGSEVTTEYTTAYTILSYEHYNVMAEGMFTVTPAHVGDNFFNPFEVGEGMKYDETMVQADIEKYGLYTYEDFAHVLTYEQFVAMKIDHFKVSVGKGYITYDGLIYLIENFVNNKDFDI